MKRLAFLFAFVAWAGCSASPDPAGERLAFAADCRDWIDTTRQLVRRGWFDLAEELCDRVEAAPADRVKDKDWIPVIRAEILGLQAERMTNVASARAAVDQAIGLLDPLLKVPPSGPLTVEARTNAGRLHRQKARLALMAATLEKDSVTAAWLRDEAVAGFRDAVDFYRMICREYKAAGADRLENQEILVPALADAEFGLPATLLELAKCPGLDRAVAKDCLIEAIRRIPDFEYFFGYWIDATAAYKVEGECYLELGDLAKAEAALRGALTLKTSLDEIGRPITAYHRTILRGAWVSLVRVLDRAGRPAEAVAAADRALKEDPDFENDPLGEELKRTRNEAASKLK